MLLDLTETGILSNHTILFGYSEICPIAEDDSSLKTRAFRQLLAGPPSENTPLSKVIYLQSLRQLHLAALQVKNVT